MPASAVGAPLGSITEEHFQLLFDINVKGVVFTVQTLLPLIREHGSIILNSSVAADRGRPGTGVYAATKAAVRSLARTWANELGSRGIRVNTVNPASTETPGLMALNDADPSVDDEQFKAQRSQGIPLGRLATPTKSPTLRCSWRATSAASPPARPCRSTAATTRSKTARKAS